MGDQDTPSTHQVTLTLDVARRAEMVLLNYKVIEQLGQETFGEVEKVIDDLSTAFKFRLLEVLDEGGDVRALLQSYRTFSNDLYVQVSSENLNPGLFDVAIQAVSGFLTLRPNTAFTAAAHKMVGICVGG